MPDEAIVPVLNTLLLDELLLPELVFADAEVLFADVEVSVFSSSVM